MKALAVIALLAAAPAHAVTVCIDAGHGGSDNGATGLFYAEKAACLDVALVARDYLAQTPGVTWVAMTRTSDIFVSLADRVAYANAHGFDRFLSVHHNAFDTHTQGTESYAYALGSSASFDMRDRVQSRLLWAFAYADRGGKTADYYVLHYTAMPAALGEASFIDYAGAYDESQRFSAAYIDHAGREGYAYCWGLADHMGLTPPPYTGGVTRVDRHADGEAVRVHVEPGRRVVFSGASGRVRVVDCAGRVAFRGDARVRLVWDARAASAGVYWMEVGAERERFVLLGR